MGAFLTEKVSQDHEKWFWTSVHVKEYPHLPFSKTPLKPLFHKEVPVGGNMNTPSKAKYRLKHSSELNSFKSTNSANYMLIVSFAENAKDDESLYSMDTGNNENPVMGNYFTMNRDHILGNLQDMKINWKTDEGMQSLFLL